MLLATEADYLTLNDAAALFPGKPHVCTVRRYATRGLNGTTLHVIRSTGKLWTTAESVREFIAMTNQKQLTTETPTRSKRLLDATRKLQDAHEIKGNS